MGRILLSVPVTLFLENERYPEISLKDLFMPEAPPLPATSEDPTLMRDKNTDLGLDDVIGEAVMSDIMFPAVIPPFPCVESRWSAALVISVGFDYKARPKKVRMFLSTATHVDKGNSPVSCPLP